MAGAPRPPRCCAVSVIDPSLSPHGQTDATLSPRRGYFVEHTDLGVYYYRKFFYGLDHQNYFGLDDRFGPVAISIKREKLIETLGKESDNRSNDMKTADNSKSSSVHAYQYRIIIRTSELTALRCAVREDAVPCSSRPTPSKGLPHRDLIDYLAPELQQSALKLATIGKNTQDQLLQVDEAGVSRCYKAGVLLCREGQATEEEMYCNESTTPAFDEFLSILGQRVKLKGWQHYRAQLDNKTDSTGTHSVYSTLGDIQLMFHVSTLLPYTANNKQQLLRKRHIGNDIVTVVFQEPGAKPFTPRSIRSHFQHVFIVVRAHNPCTENVRYSVAVSRSREVPNFGPPISDGLSYTKSGDFSNFLLAKIINAENAVHKSEKFVAMATRTRQEYLKDLATNYITSTGLDSNSRLGRFALGSVKRKDRHRKVPSASLITIKGGCSWHVQVDEQCRGKSFLDCWLVVSAEAIVVIDKGSKEVVFTCPCQDVLGWVRHQLSMSLYYGYGEMLVFQGDPEDLPDIEHRLQTVTDGCPAISQDLHRDSSGSLGLQLSASGVVMNVEPGSSAAQHGVVPASRLLEASRQLVLGQTRQGIRELLSGNEHIPVVLLPPTADGKLRKPSLLPLANMSSEHVVRGEGPGATDQRAELAPTQKLDELSLNTTRPLSRQSTLPAPMSPPASLGMGAIPWRNRYTPSPATVSHGEARQLPPDPASRQLPPEPRHTQLPDRPPVKSSPDIGGQRARSHTPQYSNISHTSQNSHASQNSFSDTLSSHSSGGGTLPRHNHRAREDGGIVGHVNPEFVPLQNTQNRNINSNSRSSSVHNTPRKASAPRPTRSSYQRPGGPLPPATPLSQVQLTRSTDFKDDLLKLINLDEPPPQASANTESGPVVAQHEIIPNSSTSRTPVKAVYSSPPEVGLSSRSRVGTRTPVQQRGTSPALPDRTPPDRALPDRALPDRADDRTLTRPAGLGSSGVTETSVDYVRQLETRVKQLEAQLASERRERTQLESEVTSLRQENQRLQEESQTAAAQLRRFTEWFFNSVDNKQ